MARRNRSMIVEENITEDVVFVPKISCSPRMRLTDLQKIEPLTDNQKLFFEAYDRGDYFVTLHGFAGTGKSLIALYKAFNEILSKGSFYKKIIIIRSAVAGRDVGHLPGTLDDKMDIFKYPYKELCAFLFNRSDAWDRLEEQKRVELVSTSYIRGVTFTDTIVIVDECQNLTWRELNTIITRVGHQSKIFFCGDVRQTDLYRNRNDTSGIKKFLDVAALMTSHTKIEFTVDDIVRSSLVRDFLIASAAYDDKEWEISQSNKELRG